MAERLRLAGSEQFALQVQNRIAVFGMDHDDGAVGRSRFESLEKGQIIHHLSALVGHEEFETGDAPVR